MPKSSASVLEALTASGNCPWYQPVRINRGGRVYCGSPKWSSTALRNLQRKNLANTRANNPGVISPRGRRTRRTTARRQLSQFAPPGFISSRTGPFAANELAFANGGDTKMDLMAQGYGGSSRRRRNNGY